MNDKNEIILYQPDETVKLEVRINEETVWLNRKHMACLFGRDVKTIGKHIANALAEELMNISVVANFATTASDGKTYNVEYYNLDMILSVGYRVKSRQGVLFRQWANSILKDYLGECSDQDLHAAHLTLVQRSLVSTQQPIRTDRFEHLHPIA